MASPMSPPGSARRAGRNISHPIARRSTTGPLETADDPLTAAKNDAVVEQSEAISTEASNAPKVAHPSIARALPPQLRFLQDPRLYHQIPKDDIPRAFLESPLQPPQNTPLTELLRQGHFRRGAETALQQLLQAPADDALVVLQLLYCRLACLSLIRRPDIAADEALPLLDFLTANTPAASEVLPWIPWPLRILLIRVQSVVAQDGGRRAIMTLYALAGECRTNIREARLSNDENTVQLWSTRLADLGLRVSDTLVEIGEVETAIRHLDSLVDVDNDEVASRKALLYLRSGDVLTARRCVEGISDSRTRALQEALISVADADVNNALSSWQSLSKQPDEKEVAAQNEAVFLLYTGRIQEGRSILETLVDKGPLFSTLLFNLSTIHELCSDKALAKKQEIITRLASRPAQSSIESWEKSTLELKL